MVISSLVKLMKNKQQLHFFSVFLSECGHETAECAEGWAERGAE